MKSRRKNKPKASELTNRMNHKWLLRGGKPSYMTKQEAEKYLKRV